jgi:hypothetical protein
VSATVPRRTRPPLAQTGVVALLLAVAAITWALTHGQRPWRTRLVRRHLGADDGGHDAAHLPIARSARALVAAH